MLSVTLLFGSIGAAAVGFGWFAYRSKHAEWLLANQFLTRALPGIICALPLSGIAFLVIAIASLLPKSLGGPASLGGAALAIVAVILCGWCPRLLLPRWLRPVDSRK